MRKYFLNEIKRTIIVLLIVLVPLSALLLFIVVVQPRLEKAKPVIPVTFETIASHEGEKISIQGRFYLGSWVSSSDFCPCPDNEHLCYHLELLPLRTEEYDWISDNLEVSIELDDTYSAEPGHFYLPGSFTDEDFSIYTSSGQELKIDNAIRVIGTVDDVYEYDEETIVRICPYQIQAGEPDCSKLIKADYEPSLWTWDIGPIDKARIIHILSDHWSNNLPEFKLFLPAGQSVSFEYGGGTILTEQPECSGSAWTIFQDDPLREITLEAYQKYIEEKIIP